MGRMYFAVVDDYGEYLHSGYNAKSETACKKEVFSLMEHDIPYGDKTIARKMSLSDFCGLFDWQVETSNKPFPPLD